MKKETNLCMSCMQPHQKAGVAKIPECQSCGWVDTGVHLASYLYPKTFLAGRYIVGKLISYNGEAGLYVGYDTLTETKITIKEYMPDALCTRSREVLPLSVNPGELPLYKAYLSEFVELNRILQSLGSLPGIQRVIDVFSENATAYAIFEELSGVTVQSYFAGLSEPLTHTQTRELFKTTFTALARANTAGIVHRGISPKTVFVLNNGGNLSHTANFSNTATFGGGKPIPYVADFAITAARICGSKLNSDVFSGYAAPEQYNEIDRHGEWTDVYGLAALLYNAITGVIPQDAPSRLKENRLVAPKHINRQIPVEVSDTIMNALSLSVNERIKTVGEFSKKLGWEQPLNVTGESSPIAYANPNSMPPLAAMTGENVKSAPVRPQINIEFDDDEDLNGTDNRMESGEKKVAPAVLRRKKEREARKKRKLMFGLIATGILVALFVVFLILALATDVFTRPVCEVYCECDDCASICTSRSDCECDDCYDEDACTEDLDCECDECLAQTTMTCDDCGSVFSIDESCSECDATAPPSAGTRQVTNFVTFPIPAHERNNFMSIIRNQFNDVFEFEFVGEFNADEPYGTIISQDVIPGEVVEVGTIITIRYSLGAEFMSLPAFNEDETPEAFRSRLIGLGFNAANVRIEDRLFDEYVAGMSGRIVEVTPAAGSNVRLRDYPGDENRRAGTIVIFRAELPYPPPETTAPPETTPATASTMRPIGS